MEKLSNRDMVLIQITKDQIKLFLEQMDKYKSDKIEIPYPSWDKVRGEPIIITREQAEELIYF